MKKINYFLLLNNVLLYQLYRYSKKQNSKLVKRHYIKERKDYLTTLGNRKALFESINKVNYKLDLDTAIIMIDVDYFKKYNDTYGHIAGDMCLHSIGTCFKKLSKEYGIKFYRYAGEEFVGIFQGTYDECIKLANLTRQSVENLNIQHEKNSYGIVTISLGLAIMNQFDSADSIIKKADIALYESKESGKNKVTIYEKGMTMGDMYKDNVRIR